MLLRVVVLKIKLDKVCITGLYSTGFPFFLWILLSPSEYYRDLRISLSKSDDGMN